MAASRRILEVNLESARVAREHFGKNKPSDAAQLGMINDASNNPAMVHTARQPIIIISPRPQNMDVQLNSYAQLSHQNTTNDERASMTNATKSNAFGAMTGSTKSHLKISNAAGTSRSSIKGLHTTDQAVATLEEAKDLVTNKTDHFNLDIPEPMDM